MIFEVSDSDLSSTIEMTVTRCFRITTQNHIYNILVESVVKPQNGIDTSQRMGAIQRKQRIEIGERRLVVAVLGSCRTAEQRVQNHEIGTNDRQEHGRENGRQVERERRNDGVGNRQAGCRIDGRVQE